ncbi:zinc metalloprotease [Actinobaculum suis]|uniref:Zinc metalloprotease n=1 Tax=Actinobaculum suis TaxID=1657 RepID=A0A7Z8YAG0_9ACTO|nr:SprT family zinc-dependent metalloprotease [Actinobaculum suis]VDG77250.1 zinc metalloprotease [Actinobaculum suis]
MPEEVEIAGIRLTLTRKRGIKNLNLRVVGPDGQVKLSAPPRASMRAITDFVTSQTGNIHRWQNQVRARAAREQRFYNDGETHYLWGIPHKLTVLPAGPTARPHLRVEPPLTAADRLPIRNASSLRTSRATSQLASQQTSQATSQAITSQAITSPETSQTTSQTTSQAIASPETTSPAIVLTVPAGASSELRAKLMVELYRAELKQALGPIVRDCEERMGLHAREYRIRNMKTRWGSCNIPKRRIWLNLQLAKWAPNCLEYVVIHELAHLVEAKHNARFHSLVETFCPDYRHLKHFLNSSIFDATAIFDAAALTPSAASAS